MRSAVPLGGLGTGTVELRSDGSFHDWLLENQGPGLIHTVHKGSHWPGGKVAKPEFVLGMRAAAASTPSAQTAGSAAPAGGGDSRGGGVGGGGTRSGSSHGSDIGSGGGGGTSSTVALTLRTTPPAGLPGAASLVYSGAYPAAQLKVVDPRLQAGTANALNTTLRVCVCVLGRADAHVASSTRSASGHVCRNHSLTSCARVAAL